MDSGSPGAPQMGVGGKGAASSGSGGQGAGLAKGAGKGKGGKGGLAAGSRSDGNRGGGGGSGGRPDWSCPHCEFLNFGRRTSCKSCGVVKGGQPAGPAGGKKGAGGKGGKGRPVSDDRDITIVGLSAQVKEFKAKAERAKLELREAKGRVPAVAAEGSTPAAEAAPGAEGMDGLVDGDALREEQCKAAKEALAKLDDDAL